MPRKLGKDYLNFVIHTRLTEDDYVKFLQLVREQNESSPSAMLRKMIRNAVRGKRKVA